MAPTCEPFTSGTNSQNVLPTSAGPSLSTLNAILPSVTAPEEVTPSRLLKMSPIPKYREKFQFQKSNFFVPTEEANNTEEKRKSEEGNKVKEQRKIESVKSPNTSSLQGQKMQKKNY